MNDQKKDEASAEKNVPEKSESPPAEKKTQKTNKAVAAEKSPPPAEQKAKAAAKEVKDAAREVTSQGAGRSMGLGDILVYVGVALTLLFSIMLLAKIGDARQGGGWLTAAVVVFLLMALFVAAAQWLSMKDQRWLMVPYAFAAFVAAMLVGNISLVGMVSQWLLPGLDFFIMVSAVACAGGAWICQGKGNPFAK